MARWGRETADSLMTLAGAKLVLPGLSDTETLLRLETLIGKHWIEQVPRSESRSGRVFGGWTWGTVRSETEQPRIPAAAIRQLPPTRGLLLVGPQRAAGISLMSLEREPLRTWRQCRSVAPVAVQTQ